MTEPTLTDLHGRPSRPRRRDWVFVALIVVVMVPMYVMSMTSEPASGAAETMALYLVSFAVSAAALAWRVARPLTTGLVILVLATVIQIFVAGVEPGMIVLGLVALYSVVARSNRRWRSVALAVALVYPFFVVWRLSSFNQNVDATSGLVLGVAGALVGGAVWVAGIYRGGDLRRDADYRARMMLLEREQEQTAALASYAERTRIAREMHDIVAHTLTGLIAQADGGRYATDPADAKEALAVISKDGRRALTDLRSLLSVLRDPNETHGRLPGQADVPGLIEEIRRSGMRVEVAVTGTPCDLPDHLGLTMFRIIQESLTNSLKHSGLSSSARLEEIWEPRRLTLRIQDDGQAAGLVESTPGGKGLLGMRERVELVGGTFTAGPAESGGFRVEAQIPLGEKA